MHFSMISFNRLISFLLAFISTVCLYSQVVNTPWVRHYDRNNGGLSENVYRLRQDEQGLIWIYTYGGLYSFDGQRFVSHKDSIPQPPMAGYHWRPKTRLEHKFFNSLEERNKKYNIRNRILCSLNDKDGNLWLGAEDGLRLLRENPYYVNFINLEEEVLCLYRSSNGELWVSTREGSLCKLDESLHPKVYLTSDGQWTPNKVNSKLVVMDIQSSPDGSLWLSARYGGLIHLIPKGPNGNAGYVIQRIKGDISLNGGLHALDNVYSSLRDEHDRLWVASLRTGVSLVSSSGNDSTSIVNLNAMLRRSKKDTISLRFRCFLPVFPSSWLSGSDDGLFYIAPSTWTNNKVGTIKELSPKNGVKSAVLTLLCDHEGFIYAGHSGGGLSVLSDFTEDGEITHLRSFTNENGNLPSDVVYSLVEDYKNRVWGFCENGLFKIVHDRENKNSVHMGSNLTIAPLNHFFSKDLPSISIGQSLALPDGRLLKGTKRGILWVNTDSLLSRNSRHQLFLQAYLRINNVDSTIVSPDTIFLTRKSPKLSIYCSILDYNRESEVIYAWRCCSQDTTWTYTSNPLIELENLPSGYSVLEIRATNGAGNWSGNERSVVVHVPVNWYPLVLRLLVIALFLLLFFLLYRKMTRKKKVEPIKILTDIPTKDIVEGQFRKDVRQCILDHLDDSEYGSTELAADLCISKSMLNSKIKNVFDITPTELITQVRIQAATELITGTELSISEIAYSVGFNDPKYFSRVYKKVTNNSPTDIRRKNK